MKWKTFLQIILLIIFAAVVFYIVYPKWYFSTYSKGNKITGRVEDLRWSRWQVKRKPPAGKSLEDIWGIK